MTNTHALVPVQTVPDDDKLVAMWLALKSSDNTRRAYAHIVEAFRQHTGRPLADITLADLLSYVETVQGSTSTRALHTNALKSLFTYCSELFPTVFPINYGKALKAPKAHSKLAQRILSEVDVIRMIDRTENKRDHALLRLMYHAGLRVSEVVALTWGDIRRADNGAVLDVWGKGDKQRYVLISASMMDELESLDGRYLGADRYVFMSRKSKGGALPMDASQVDRIVLEAAKRAGIDANVSAHWLRHANASHSLDNGATVAVVQQSLGHASLVTTSKYLHIKPGTGSSQYLKI